MEKHVRHLALTFLLATGCAQSTPALLAYGGPGVLGSGPLTNPAAEDAPPDSRLPDQVLRDPEERMNAMLQLRRQIVYKTRSIADPRYRAAIRPSIARQLRAAGLSSGDVDFLLAEVDYSRQVDR
jgi:hypothetical protein